MFKFRISYSGRPSVWMIRLMLIIFLGGMAAGCCCGRNGNRFWHKKSDQKPQATYPTDDAKSQEP